jgi:hypothetical protein
MTFVITVVLPSAAAATGATGATGFGVPLRFAISAVAPRRSAGGGQHVTALSFCWYRSLPI